MANNSTQDEFVIGKPSIVLTDKSQIITGIINESLTIRIQPLRCIVDTHAHIENGACVPLPLVWSQNKLLKIFTPRRSIVNTLVNLKMKEAGELQVKPTFEIGWEAYGELDATFGTRTVISQSDLYKDKDVFSIMVIMMMDLEYACINGYWHDRIYLEKGEDWEYIERNEKDWRKIKYSTAKKENQKTFTKWAKQLEDTLLAMTYQPLRMMAMYHYEPRRWNYSKTELSKVDKNLDNGPWDYPFNEIATPNKPGAFIGFKMYTRLGYKPLDEFLPLLHDKTLDNDCFYARCEREGIPILVHCSPGGMTTHEAKFYKGFDDEPKYNRSSFMIPATYSKDDELETIHFNLNYVHPKAWKKVLDKYPKLKLCLAHFGGELWESTEADSRDPNGDWIGEIIELTKLANVYTDFSCWNFGKNNMGDFKFIINEYPYLKNKILFGTDWYMTLIALDGTTYRTFCNNFWNFFMDDKFEQGQELWQRFTFINPFKFYGFNNMATIDNIANALLNKGANPELIDINRKKFQGLIKDFDKICDKIEKGLQ